MNIDRLDWLALHGNVPNLQGEVVARQDISAVPGELDVGNGRDDLGEEGFLGRVFLFLEFWPSARYAHVGLGSVQDRSNSKGADSRFACESHSAASRISASLIVPFELEYMNMLQCIGWNSAAVITSVSSSMFTGLMSTMSAISTMQLSSLAPTPTEALVADVQVPQVNPQIICRDVRLPIRVDADRVDVVSVCVGVHLSRHSSGDAVVCGHAG